MRFIIAIAAVLISFVTITAQAAPVVGLYQVREVLESQESDVRDAGLQQAFVTLMQRLTGQADAAQAAQLAEYNADPQALISRYGYEGNTLIVNFDPQSVQAALDRTDLPQWGSNRPVVLTWWLVDDLNGQRLLSDGQPSAQSLASAAQYYGVPTRLPLGDLADQMLIGRDALSNSQDIRGSAERYSADAVMLVQQTIDGDALLAQWYLWIGDEEQQGQVSEASQAALEHHVFAQVNQSLAQRFAIMPGQGELLNVRVAGVDLERFVLLERLLEPFAAQLQEVSQDHAQWQVRSTVEQLKTQLALGHLQEQAAPLAQVETYADASAADSSISSAPHESQANSDGARVLYFSW
ncbi:DUF2066 domain-containing protein [Pseudomonas sp. C27(2019)]|uniref:DUF2066 domain-containing protein n=1 Tax=Pseudomonas sp. C27(2019) TaxID=2604941 RepID=UPI001245901B|nr:DUF2066 domain-containing protein [Pseudomonas sp. C27(2019)]QEY58434.1 DUF2066 domain-containing protein [Pseudomonas sp. C27(2019)]